MSEAKTFLTQLNILFTKHEKNMFEYHKKFFEDYSRLLQDVNGQRSAKKLIKLIEGKEYPREFFFSVQCIQTNNEPCIIMTEQGEVEFPPNSFFKAAMYPINILMLKKSGGAEFIGYVK